MIRNFTEAEWDALVSAITLQDVTWEQDGDETGVNSRSSYTRRRALYRALNKARQLAPEEARHAR